MKRFLQFLASPFNLLNRQGWKRKLTWFNIISAGFGFLLCAYMMYIHDEPDIFDPIEYSQSLYLRKFPSAQKGKMPLGFLTGATFYRIAHTLLEKRGGYVSNDVAHPSILMDDIPNWEQGVLVQLRDFVDVLRRSGSSSTASNQDQGDLILANSSFNIDPEAWIMPSAEGAYSEGINHVMAFLNKMGRQQQKQSFFPRADILDMWLDRVFTRLAVLSQDLTDVGQSHAPRGAPHLNEQPEDSPGGIGPQNWNRADDVFYRSRGECWVIYHLLLAIQVDYHSILQSTGNLEIIDNIIDELSYSLMPVQSPVILSGYKFGIFSNHSLALATYISRTKVLIVDLRSNLAI